MNYRIHIRGERKDPPELDRVVAALLALALARVDAERAKQERQPDRQAKEARD